MKIELIVDVLKYGGICAFVLLLVYGLLMGIIKKLNYNNITSEQNYQIIKKIIKYLGIAAVLSILLYVFLEIKKDYIDISKTKSQVKLTKDSVPSFSTVELNSDLSDTLLSNKFNEFILSNQGEVVRLDVSINLSDNVIMSDLGDEDLTKNPFFIFKDENFEYKYVLQRNEELYNVRTFDSGYFYLTGYFSVGNQTAPSPKYSYNYEGMAIVVVLKPIPAENVSK